MSATTLKEPVEINRTTRGNAPEASERRRPSTPRTTPDGRALGDERRLAEVCRRYGVGRLDIFGSVSRGDAGPSSDVDVLYELAPGLGSAGRSRTSPMNSRSCSGDASTSCRAPRCTNVSATRSSPKLSCSMRRELLVIEAMIDAAEHACSLVAGIQLSELKTDRNDAMLCCGTSRCWARPPASSSRRRGIGSPRFHGLSRPD